MEKVFVNDNFIKSNDEELFEVIGVQEEYIDSLTTAPYSYWKEVFRALVKNKAVWICLVLFAIVLFFTIFGNFWCYWDPNTLIIDKYATPSTQHWFGVDGKGRDIWTITWSGAKISLLLSILVSLINIGIGLVIGSLWGYFPKLDPFMIEVRNFFSNVPSLLLNIMFMKLFLKANVDAFWAVTFCLCFTGWLGLASTIRNQIIIIRNRDFNIASKTLGAKSITMIVHNMMPQIIAVVVTLVANSIPAAIDGEVSLAFFGLSVSSPINPTLGFVINQGAADSNWTDYPHIVLLPALVTIFITVTCYYIGFAIADAADPRTHR